MWKQFYREKWGYLPDAENPGPQRRLYIPSRPDLSATDRYFMQLDNMQWRHPSALDQSAKGA